MQKELRYIFFLFFAFDLALSAFSSKAQQLKLGNNPTQIEKSAVLELQSNNQGLLLTRVPDTNVINTLIPPDGMIIYFTDGKTSESYGPNAGVYQRKDGAWQRIAQFFTVSTDPSGPDNIEFTYSHDTITLHLPDASPTTRGVVNADVQSFAGDKTFNDSLISDGGLRSNDAQIDGNLILTLSKNTNPTSAEWFLSTDANGKVFLQKIDNVFWKLGGNSISSGTADSLGTLSNTDLPIITNGTERMRITKDGKVGIGTNNPSNTLTVNGSFKLGQSGSSFSAMKRDSIINFTINGNGYIPTSWTINGIKKNAHVIVNPRDALLSGSNIAIISWAWASNINTVTICFYTTGSMNITRSFDVYYINP